MSGHTPGPWEWSAGRLFYNDRKHFSSHNVLVIHEEKWEPMKADADLIAAAPDLLEAAKAFVAAEDALLTALRSEAKHMAFTEAPWTLVDALRTAISKAEGRL